MISLIPATAGGRHDVTMSQGVSQTVQEKIDELVRRTCEKEEERKKKKKALLAGETTSTSQERPSGLDKSQETTTAMSVTGHTILIKHIDKGDKSAGTKKMDDKLGQEKEIDVEEQEEIDVEEHGKMTVEPEGESTDDDEPEDEPSVVSRTLYTNCLKCMKWSLNMKV